MQSRANEPGLGKATGRRLSAVVAALSCALLGPFALIQAPASATASLQAEPAPQQAPAGASAFQAVGSVLAYDSTVGDGPMLPGSTRMATLAGLPATAHSALLMLTARNAAKRGAITVGQTVAGRAVAKFAFPARITKSMIVLVPVSAGQVVLQDTKRSNVDIKVNLLGYSMSAVPPKAKGRPAVALAHGKWAAGAAQTIAVAHQYGAPGTKKLVAALLRITTHQAATAGQVQVAPQGAAASPVASIAAGQTTSTIALVPTGRMGQLNISATVDARVRVELIGYVSDTEAPAPAAESTPPPNTPAPAPAQVPTPSPSVPAAATGAAAVAVQYAMSKIGNRYAAGGVGPDSFDCSGLTMAAWAAAGVKLTHLSYTQYDQTQHIALADIQPGDLLFYFGNGLHHVTMYVGNGQMANAANPAAGVVLTSVNDAWYAQHLTGVGHVTAA